MPISQNKKIIISAFGLFVVALTSMILFLTNATPEHSEANVLGSQHGVLQHGDENSMSLDNLEATYRKEIEDDKSPFFVINTDGKFTFATDDFCEMFAYNPQDLKNVDLYELLNKSDLSKFFAEQVDVLQSKTPEKALGPYIFKHRNHRYLLLLNVYPLPKDAENIEELLFTFKDLTDALNETPNPLDEDDSDNRKAPSDNRYHWQDNAGFSNGITNIVADKVSFK